MSPGAVHWHIHRARPRPIVLDVDGVLLDCDGAFARVAALVLARPVEKLCSAYNLTQRYGLTQDEVDRVWDDMNHHPHGWIGMPALPGAADAFAQLKAMDHEIHLVTAIPETLETMRWECLKGHGMIPHHIHCAGHHAASKSDIVRAIDPIMIVDDRLVHLHGADGVPHRVFVDHGDDQGGLVATAAMHRVSSLAEWVQWWFHHGSGRQF